MPTTFSETAKQAGEQYTQLQQASKQLETVLGADAPLVNAHWDRLPDEAGRPVFELRLKDPHGEVAGKFNAGELQSQNVLGYRLYRLWGDLLKVQIKQHLQAIAEN